MSSRGLAASTTLFAKISPVSWHVTLSLARSMRPDVRLVDKGHQKVALCTLDLQNEMS